MAMAHKIFFLPILVLGMSNFFFKNNIWNIDQCRKGYLPQLFWAFRISLRTGAYTAEEKWGS